MLCVTATTMIAILYAPLGKRRRPQAQQRITLRQLDQNLPASQPHDRKAGAKRHLLHRHLQLIQHIFEERMRPPLLIVVVHLMFDLCRVGQMNRLLPVRSKRCASRRAIYQRD